ncbi:hypothetical protein [Mangrovicoccus sp. HB161399]|uniref:hypothetical protein n=1 Tax=Mangrovicoccus sp. HB161399 TaxID=2720392 RepID=UPI0015540247|nr:hypothetical protein [Mangrovicoccus sp. HB161399]
MAAAELPAWLTTEDAQERRAFYGEGPTCQKCNLPSWACWTIWEVTTRVPQKDRADLRTVLEEDARASLAREGLPSICTADGYPFEMMGRDGE